MGKTSTWTINEYVPVSLVLSTQPINFNLPVFLQFEAGVNGYFFTVQQGTSVLLNQEALYGTTAIQFEQLALLW